MHRKLSTFSEVMLIEVFVYIFVSFQHMLLEHSEKQFTWENKQLVGCKAQIKWQTLSTHNSSFVVLFNWKLYNIISTVIYYFLWSLLCYRT